MPVIRDQRDAQYDAQKILNLFRSKSKDMKALYGRYSINFPMAGLIISQNEEFFRKLKELLNFQHKLSDLIMRFLANIYIKYFKYYQKTNEQLY